MDASSASTYEFEGFSYGSLDDAVSDALVKAFRSTPEATWFEVTKIGGTILKGGGLGAFRVELTVGISTDT